MINHDVFLSHDSYFHIRVLEEGCKPNTGPVVPSDTPALFDRLAPGRCEYSMDTIGVPPPAAHVPGTVQTTISVIIHIIGGELFSVMCGQTVTCNNNRIYVSFA